VYTIRRLESAGPGPAGSNTHISSTMDSSSLIGLIVACSIIGIFVLLTLICCCSRQARRFGLSLLVSDASTCCSRCVHGCLIPDIPVKTAQDAIKMRSQADAAVSMAVENPPHVVEAVITRDIECKLYPFSIDSSECHIDIDIDSESTDHQHQHQHHHRESASASALASGSSFQSTDRSSVRARCYWLRKHHRDQQHAITVSDVKGRPPLLESDESDDMNDHDQDAKCNDNSVAGAESDDSVSDRDPMRAVIVFSHGGGFVSGSMEGYDNYCKAMCHRLNCAIVSVDYRRAPDEGVFPAALEDVYAAIVWTHENGMNVFGTNTICVMGDSAGGNLAAAVCRYMCNKLNVPPIAAQLLLSPCCDPNAELDPQACKYSSIKPGQMRSFWHQYVPRVEDRTHPYVNLIEQGEKYPHLPPALFLLAEMDPLCDEAELYAALLQANGTTVSSHVAPDSHHGYTTFLDFSSHADDALHRISEFIDEHVCSVDSQS
jgi:acetyl esterase/lipase